MRYSNSDNKNLKKNCSEQKPALHNILTSLTQIVDEKFILTLNDFLKYLIQQKGYSKYTIYAYCLDLKSFLFFLAKNSSNIININYLGKTDIFTIRSWLAYRVSKNVSPRSNARAITTLKTFSKYLKTNLSITWSATEVLLSPRYTKSLPRPLSSLDIKEIINFENLQNTYLKNKIKKPLWIIHRNIALITLIYATGLRISEALSLTKLDLSNNTLKIVGKGSKVRLVPLLGSIKSCLNDYYKFCPFPISENQSPFFNNHGNRLMIRSCQKIIEEIRVIYNLPKSFTPHALRHSFATDLLNNGGSIRVIQELLGHASISSTQGYTKIEEAKLMDNYQKFHPKGSNKTV